MLGFSIDSDSSVCYLGGTIDKRDEMTIQKLLFRVTRGQANVNTFDLNIEDDDQLRNDDFNTRLIGYTVMFHDTGAMRKTVMRVC